MKKRIKTTFYLAACLIGLSWQLMACGGNARNEPDENETYIDTLLEGDPQDGNNMRNEQPTEPLTQKDSVSTDSM
ncbi:hypothetical protein [Olivibacter sitiensis]|uniref:hypothetical protein n=1 Tax=Olivibacter sitiensis TaxID=376470 RepID=UPI00041910D2|nr:hypothetical protein [Olivibacter sitiensis]